MYQELLKASLETLYMVLVSGLIGAVVGIPLGILLTITRKKYFLPQKSLYNIINFVVNVLRSIPFPILMIALIPFTHLILGTSIGTTAAIIPLSVAAIPFVARLAEESFLNVPFALIETCRAMGATNQQIISKVLLAEAKANLVNNITVTLINLVTYSAMAGLIGGGGLGTLAIHYGYQRFDVQVMFITVIILILMVQCIQFIGEYIVRCLQHKANS